MKKQLNLDNYLAKSTGAKFIDHAKAVAELAVSIAMDNLLPTELEEPINILDKIRKAALLHDLGKLTHSFQKMLKSNKIEKKSTFSFRHNEIGWAIASMFTNLDDYVLNSIYWHHGISNRMATYIDNTIYTELEIDNEKKNYEHSDIDVMVAAISELIGEEHIIEFDSDREGKTAPTYYTSDKEFNMYSSYIRTCVISADHIVSKHEGMDITEIKKIYATHFSKLIVENYTNPYNNDRFAKQVEISETPNKTTIIKAPAGFGKTMVGTLWSLKSDKKLIWVCPRNTIAHSAYTSIIDELRKLKVDLSVELYLTGEVVKSTNESTGFTSDIIVTNIDNYLTPTIDNRNSDKLHMIVNGDVVFDEYHELLGEEALFSCFVNIMNVRNKLTKSRTLLLSATPIEMDFLWSTLGSKTEILPNKNTHFPAAHSNKYRINVTNDIELKTNNSLIIYNSIIQSQINMIELDVDKLLHSEFAKQKKIELMEYLYDTHGKNSGSSPEKPNFISTPVIQASLDISFNHLYESVLSPESTLQRIGRCDRWGDYTVHQPTINIFNNRNRSEETLRDVLYRKDLTDIWFSYLSENLNGSTVSLDELYVHYNDFSNKRSNYIKSFIKERLALSLSKMNTLYPVKFDNELPKSDVISAGGNKLRSTDTKDFFYIVENHDGSGYSDIFMYKQRNGISIQSAFKEPNNVYSGIMNVIKHLNKTKDPRFDYTDLLTSHNRKSGRLGTEDLLRRAKKSNTPYVRFSSVYHEDLGMIDKNKLSLLFPED